MKDAFTDLDQRRLVHINIFNSTAAERFWYVRRVREFFRAVYAAMGRW